MPGLDAARLRALADELDAEEAAAKRELEQAETAEEREAARKELADVRAELAELKEKVAAGPGGPPAGTDEATADEKPPADELEQKRRKTRPGRKRGQLYEGEDGVGYIYNGPDEPAVVILEDEDEDGEEATG